MRGQPRPLPSAQLLRELFQYDKTTGRLTWKVDRGPRKLAGRAAGSRHKYGALVVEIDAIQYKVHRIIWKIVTGRDPNPEVDHRNRIKSDNRWRNLREASWQDNARNRARRSDSKNPYKGIRCDRRWSDRWYARIQIAPGKRVEVGRFDTAEEAYAAYCKAARQYHKDFATP